MNTKKLIEIEWFILARSGFFWTIVLLCIVCMIFCPFILYKFTIDDQNSRFQMLEMAFSFPVVFNTISVVELLPIQLLCIFMIYLICDEFEFDNYRLHIQSGKSRDEIWYSKFLLCIIFSICAIILVIILSLVIGFINDKYSLHFNFNSLKSLFIFFIQTFTFLGFAVTFALIIRKTGPAIIIYLLWFGVFERTLAHFINGSFNLNPIGSLLPGKSIEDLNYLHAFKGFIIRDESFQLIKIFSGYIWAILIWPINYILFKVAKY